MKLFSCSARSWERYAITTPNFPGSSINAYSVWSWKLEIQISHAVDSIAARSIERLIHTLTRNLWALGYFYKSLNGKSRQSWRHGYQAWWQCCNVGEGTMKTLNHDLNLLITKDIEYYQQSFIVWPQCTVNSQLRSVFQSDWKMQVMYDKCACICVNAGTSRTALCGNIGIGKLYTGL